MQGRTPGHTPGNSPGNTPPYQPDTARLTTPRCIACRSRDGDVFEQAVPAVHPPVRSGDGPGAAACRAQENQAIDGIVLCVTQAAVVAVILAVALWLLGVWS